MRRSTKANMFAESDRLIPLDTPLLRVSRLEAACQRCRQAKIRCDGKLPACTACERSNKASECSSANDQFARGKERSYVATLESAVETLEAKINAAKQRRKSSVQMLDAMLSPQKLEVFADDGGMLRNPRAEQRKELSNMDELVSDFGLMTVNATSRDFHGFNAAITYSRLILAAAAREPLPTGLRQALPPRTKAAQDLDYYLNTVHVILPIVEEIGLYSSLHAIDGQDHANLASPRDHWNIRLVLAITSAMQSNQRGDQLYLDAVGHISSALDVAEKVLHPGSVWSIQALLLLTIYAMTDPAHFDSWTLIGAASRMMVDIGMHQDPSKSVRMDRVRLETRRRVFWCVYALDRSTSIVQTRAFSFSDDGCSVAMPFGKKTAGSSQTERQESWNPAHDTTLELFKLRQLQSRWYTSLFQSGREPWQAPYSYIWARYEEMSGWFHGLPSSLSPAIRDFFELELHYSYVYLLAPSPRCPFPSDHAQKLMVEHAMLYAEKMHAVISSSVETRTPMSFYDAMRVYMTGRQYLDCLSKNTEYLLQPKSSTPLSLMESGPRTSEVELDPMSHASPPPIPPDPVTTPGSMPKDPNSRAIDCINHFIEVLSYFGTRLGIVAGISWRDRFHRESQPLLSQLYQRKASLSSLDSFAMYHPGPVTPPILIASPGSNAIFYPSPAISQYSPPASYAQHIPQLRQDLTSAQTQQPWSSPVLGTYPPQTEYLHPAGPDQPAPESLDNLGIHSYAAYETLPGGDLNVRFPR